MIGKEKLTEWISLYVGDDLEGEERARLEDHLRDHPEARELLEKYRLDHRRISQLNHLKVSDGIWNNYWEEIETKIAHSQTRNQKIIFLSQWTKAALAASLLLAVFLIAPQLLKEQRETNHQFENHLPPVKKNLPGATTVGQNQGGPAVNGNLRMSPEARRYFFIQLRKLIQEEKKKPLYLEPKLPGENRFQWKNNGEKSMDKEESPKKPADGKKQSKPDSKVMEF